MSVQIEVRKPVTTRMKRDKRIELRVSADERAVLVAAAKIEDSDLTSFMLSYALPAAQKVVGDPRVFELDAEAAQRWEELNDAPPRTIAGLVELLQRPSPFSN